MSQKIVQQLQLIPSSSLVLHSPEYHADVDNNDITPLLLIPFATVLSEERTRVLLV